MSLPGGSSLSVASVLSLRTAVRILFTSVPIGQAIDGETDVERTWSLRLVLVMPFQAKRSHLMLRCASKNEASRRIEGKESVDDASSALKDPLIRPPKLELLSVGA